MCNNFLHKKRFIFRRFVKIFVDRPPISEKKLDQPSSKAGGGHYSQSPLTKSTIRFRANAAPHRAPHQHTPPFSRKDLRRLQNNLKKPQKKIPEPFFKNQNKRV